LYSGAAADKISTDLRARVVSLRQLSYLFGIILCSGLFVYVCFCCIRFSFFSIMPRDWL